MSDEADVSDTWAAEPEHSDAVIRARTGRGWEQWRELIDAWPGHTDGHAAVASWLQREHDLGGWWAQSVTVGWERITGRRLPHQVADGTFTAGRSATVATDPDRLQRRLHDEAGLAELFPGLDPELRSRPTSKNARIALADGVAEIAVTVKEEGRATVTVNHTKLSSPEQVERWKRFWADWLESLDES